MGARVIDGRGLAAKLKEELAAESVRRSLETANAGDVVGTGTISIDGSARRERIVR